MVAISLAFQGLFALIQTSFRGTHAFDLVIPE